MPAGVTQVEGSFERGDAVVIRNGEGAELGRGLAAYDHEEAQGASSAARAVKSPRFSATLAAPELIHRDDMVLQRKS